MKSILVTGGTGFIGSSIVKSLVKNNYKVKVFDNESRGALRRLGDIKGEFEFIKGDIRDLKAVINASKNIDTIIHLAYINGTEFFYSIPELVLEVGVKGMLNVLDASLKNNISEVYLASSSEVYATPKIIPTPEDVELVVPDPFNPRFSYGGGKIISELLLINYGRKYLKRAVIFRPHNVYGPDMGTEHIIPQFILRMKKMVKESPEKKILNFPIQGTGKETRAFIYIDDFTRGFMKIFNKGKHMNIYNIGVEEEVPIKKIADEVGKYFKKRIKIVTSKLSEGSTKQRCPDIRKLRSLGFAPKIDLSIGIALTADWYIKNLQN